MSINLSDIFAGAGSGGGISWDTVDLIDAPSISLDWSSGSLFTVELGGNRVLKNPTVGSPGFKELRIKQDGSGGRTLSWEGRYLFPNKTPPVLSTTPNHVDVFNIIRFDDDSYYVTPHLGYV